MVFDSQPLPLKRLASSGRTLRMDEEYRAKLFRFGPDRVELWVGKVFAQHAAADCSSAQALLSDRSFQLLNCKVGILKC